MATNNKKKNNKKQQNTKTPIYVLSAIAALLIVAIIILIGVNSCSEPKKSEPTVTESIVEKIAALDIKENPVATLTMENGGVIVMELYPNIAPNTVCNFIELANSGYYDGLIFHRCIKEFMIQGGCPEGTGTGGPGYTILGEFANNGFENPISHERGVISMARSSAYDSAGSQFFITVADSTFLDTDYAPFGKVIEGMEVADAIVAIETGANDKPVVDQVIKSIRVDTKGITYPEAEKLQ